MNKQFFVLMNHELTQEQKDEALKSLGCTDIIIPPEDIKRLWACIPPRGEIESTGISKVIEYLDKKAHPGDILLIQGDFGAACFIVDYCLKNSLIPVYSTSTRVYSEEKNEDGSIKRTHTFRHIQFRKYRQYEGKPTVYKTG